MLSQLPKDISAAKRDESHPPNTGSPPFAIVSARLGAPPRSGSYSGALQASMDRLRKFPKIPDGLPQEGLYYESLYAIGPFRVDPGRRLPLRENEPVALRDRRSWDRRSAGNLQTPEFLRCRHHVQKINCAKARG